MTVIFAIDPGASYCGCAIFADDKLFATATVKVDETRRAYRPSRLSEAVASWYSSVVSEVPVKLVVEHMEIYPRQKEPPNDVLSVQTVTGALLASIRANEYVSPLPKEWKGQLPKAVHHNRLRSKLSPGDAAVEQRCKTDGRRKAQWNDHELDAIGLGLWALKK